MDHEKIKRGVELLLEGIGEDLQRPGLQETPERVAGMYADIFAGLHATPHLKSVFSEESTGESVVHLRRIDFYSICEHHLLPFFGTIDISYRPTTKIAGFSSFSRLVDDLARRPQIQERLTSQIADIIMTELEPAAVRVVSKATQLCTCMRGSHRKRMQTICETSRGQI
ncbi:MAG: GTP cyclohydrolase I [Calditrichia bacterium]